MQRAVSCSTVSGWYETYLDRASPDPNPIQKLPGSLEGDTHNGVLARGRSFRANSFLLLSFLAEHFNVFAGMRLDRPNDLLIVTLVQAKHQGLRSILLVIIDIEPVAL